MERQARYFIIATLFLPMSQGLWACFFRSFQRMKRFVLYIPMYNGGIFRGQYAALG